MLRNRPENVLVQVTPPSVERQKPLAMLPLVDGAEQRVLGEVCGVSGDGIPGDMADAANGSKGVINTIPITGERLRIGNTEWSAGAGWATDTDRRDGIYGRVGILVRR